MRFGTGPDAIEIPVRWFFADERPILPHATPYGSINWRGVEERPPQGDGEVVGASRKWVNGEVPQPECCQALLRLHGGLAVGGSAEFSQGDDLTSTGGAVGNGVGLWGEDSISTGGAVGDGVGQWATAWISTGGAVGDGVGQWATAWISTGGAVGDGVGQWGVGAGDSIRLALRVQDVVTTGGPTVVTDSSRLALRVQDVVTTGGQPVVTDSSRLALRVQDVITTGGPTVVTDSSRLALRVQDVITTGGPTNVTDSIRLALRSSA